MPKIVFQVQSNMYCCLIKPYCNISRQNMYVFIYIFDYRLTDHHTVLYYYNTVCQPITLKHFKLKVLSFYCLAVFTFSIMTEANLPHLGSNWNSWLTYPCMFLDCCRKRVPRKPWSTWGCGWGGRCILHTERPSVTTREQPVFLLQGKCTHHSSTVWPYAGLYVLLLIYVDSTCDI